MFKIKSSRLILAILLIISTIFRIGSSLFLGDQVVNLPGTYDQISYDNLAMRVLNGHGFTFGQAWWPATAANAPTAHWSYLYTLYLVVVYFLFGHHPLAARLIQAVIVGTLQPYMTYLIANRVFKNLDPWIGLISAALTGIYIYFIYYAGALMTESYFILAVLASLYIAILLVDRIKKTIYLNIKSADKSVILLCITFGLTMGTAILLRQLFLIFIPFLFVWIWLSGRKYLVTTLIVSGTVILAMIIPFTIYNYIRFERFVLLNTNSGYAFFWANHPIYGTHFLPILPPEMGSYQSLIPNELRNLDEAALDQALLKRGIQFVLDDPVRYILLSLSRIPVYFMFWPSKDSGLISNISRVASFGLLWPFMLYGLIRSIYNEKPSLIDHLASPTFLLILFILLYSLIHLLSWALIRYRLPVDAVLIVFAGLSFVDLSQHVYTWRGSFARFVKT